MGAQRRRPIAAEPDGGIVRLRVDLAYRGDGFCGWQRQQGGLRTVQGALEEAIRQVGAACGPLVAAGRTDAGVHARGQVCHGDAATEADADRIIRALPGLVPADIRIVAIRPVSPAFDARFSALSRRYSYELLLRPDLFRPFAWPVTYRLDRAAMDAACRHLVGEHDFASFCKSASLRENNGCRVDLCAFDWRDDSAIFHVRADRFLHNMVRNLVGTLVEVGRSARRPEEVPRILAAKDRRQAGPTAPPNGLFLEEVVYPAALDDPDYRPRTSADAGPAPGAPDREAKGGGAS
jgi:tRNA pseudouridine38-40 synthase